MTHFPLTMKFLFAFGLFISLGGTVAAQGIFDPATDTLAITGKNGVWHILIPEKVLIRSAQAVSPLLTQVHDVRVQDIHNKPYLFFRGTNRDHQELGYTVMVLLVEVSNGIWKTGEIYQACWGDTCSQCGFDEYWGCACERYSGPVDEEAKSYCNHLIALGMGLGKVDMAASELR